MKINKHCKTCGQEIEPNWPKIKGVAGGSALVILAGLMLGTPTGWMAVIPAALAGSRSARTIAQMKIRLAVASGKAGGYFRCRQCQRDVGVGEILFGGEPPALPQ